MAVTRCSSGFRQRIATHCGRISLCVAGLVSLLALHQFKAFLRRDDVDNFFENNGHFSRHLLGDEDKARVSLPSECMLFLLSIFLPLYDMILYIQLRLKFISL